MVEPQKRSMTTTQRMRPVRDEASFTRNLRYEIAGVEGRAMLGSSTFSIILGVLWVLLVLFGPQTKADRLLPPDEAPIEVTVEPPPPPEEPIKTETAPAAPVVAAPKAKAAPDAAAAARKAQRQAAQIAGAFGAAAPGPANGPVGDVSNVLRGVAVANNSTPAGAATAGKQVLAYGQGGAGSRTPGRGDIGNGSGGTAGIGGVTGGGGFGQQGVRISAPRVVGAPSVGGVGRDVGELGTAVREHQSQLQFCYQEYGLKVNPSLAGSITLSLSLTGTGAVTNAVVTNRTWSGPGSDAAESCILQRARGWHFPASQAGAGTFEFTFNFNK
jgi:hypothetical protein